MSTQQTDNASTTKTNDNKAVFAPLGIYAIIAFIMVSIIVTTTIMLDKQLKAVEENVAVAEEKIIALKADNSTISDDNKNTPNVINEITANENHASSTVHDTRAVFATESLTNKPAMTVAESDTAIDTPAVTKAENNTIKETPVVTMVKSEAATQTPVVTAAKTETTSDITTETIAEPAASTDTPVATITENVTVTVASAMKEVRTSATALDTDMDAADQEMPVSAQPASQKVIAAISKSTEVTATTSSPDSNNSNIDNERQERKLAQKVEQKQRMADVFLRLKTLEAQRLDEYKTRQDKQIEQLATQVGRQQQMIDMLIQHNKTLFEIRAANAQRNQTNREQILNRI